MEYWIWMRLLKGIGPIVEKRLLKEFKIPEAIYNASEEQFTNIVGVGPKIAKEIMNNRSLEGPKRILDTAHKNNIKFLTCNDLLYKDIADKWPEMPTFLYYKGNIKEKAGIAIVGSRRCTNYGKKIAIEAAEYLVKNEIPVISGMAKGIDGYAHTACINAGGYTIAFLGNGLDICYPKEHAKLMESIIENGAVISEYPPGVKARPEYFPRRNYLICSWSEKVLVVEASRESGALITANIAKSQHKKVLAVPSDIYSITGQGTNRLILDGAEIYLNTRQLLLDEYKSLVKDEEKIKPNIELIEQKMRNLNIIENKIVSCLENEIKTIEEISKSINMRTLKFIEYITILELDGIIKNVPGGRYTKSD